MTSKVKSLVTAAGFVSASLVTNSVLAVQTVDPGLVEYKKESGVAGNSAYNHTFSQKHPVPCLSFYDSSGRCWLSLLLKQVAQ
jgi:hypothetical protein